MTQEEIIALETLVTHQKTTNQLAPIQAVADRLEISWNEAESLVAGMVNRGIVVGRSVSDNVIERRLSTPQNHWWVKGRGPEKVQEDRIRKIATQMEPNCEVHFDDEFPGFIRFRVY